ncbi:hypothetical protein GH146_01570 [archaeon]|nr:hypothetical protein [archaeon]
MGSKRGTLQVVSDILTFCSEPRCKTWIMYGNNMSYRMTRFYLKELISRGILVKKWSAFKDGFGL